AEAPAARRLAADSAHVLAAAAEAIGRTPRAISSHATAAALPTLPELPAGNSEGWHWSATAVLTHLNSITTLLNGLDTSAPATSTVAPELLADAPALATLRAHLNPSGEIGRHALRLAVAAGIAETFVRITGLYEGRWVVLTVFLVLKPDYNSTVSRGVHRAIGTAVGALAGALIAMLLHGTPVCLALAAGVAVAAAYAVFEVDYLRYSIYLTVFIVLLLDILGLSAETTATVRLADTALGALLALVAYAVWPTWHARNAPQIFARLVDAHQTYAAALRHELDAVGAPDAHRLRTLQSAARRARTDAEAAAARLAAEPPQPRLTADAAQALVAAATRLARAELSLHTLVTAPAATRLDPAQAAALTAATEAALADLTAQFAALSGPSPAIR
ncbi:FUSC family protein, partial [Actinospica sp. MGRD01-02]